MRTVVHRARRRFAALRKDDGSQTVEIMLWIGAFIVLIGVVGAVFRTQLVDFFNSLTYDIGL